MRKIFLVTAFLLSFSFWQPAGAQINKVYFYYMGHNYLVDKNYQDAISTLNTLLKADPDAYEAYYMRGIAKYNLDDMVGAEQDFSATVEKNPVYTMAYYNRAITRLRMSNFDDALKDFAEVIALRPDFAGSFFSRGIAYFQLEKYEQAVSDFDEFILRDDKVTDAYINRGTSYLFLGDTVRAMVDYDKAVRTNMYDQRAYNRRGTLYLQMEDYDKAMADFDHAIKLDSTYANAYFNKAMVYANTKRPLETIENFSRVLELEPDNALTYFNRALTRSQIGDYNNALADYDQVSRYAPGNVLVYYNRAAVRLRLGDLDGAMRDYTKAIELYPDFANAYINRAGVRAMQGDPAGARQDHNIADTKIAEYRSKLNDSTFSVYADTSRRFSQLLAFDSKLAGTRLTGEQEDTRIAMLPQFRFTLLRGDVPGDGPGSAKPDAAGRGGAKPVPVNTARPYFHEKLSKFISDMDIPYLVLTTKDTDISPDSVMMLDRQASERIQTARADIRDLFEKGITQGLVKQYTSSVNIYGEAVDKDPTNPFLYLNRAAIRSEMIDFVSSISMPVQRLSVDGDPGGIVNSTTQRTYNYDEAISDLNKTMKLLPDFAHAYYNRGNLQVASGRLAEAYADYTKAIELYPDFAEAYYNRGLVQIYMKDVQKGSLDVSKAGELGIKEAYVVLRRYASEE